MILITEFLKQVKKNPNNIAAIDGRRQITYTGINKRSDFVSSHIIKNNFKNGHIALFFEQGIDMIIAVLSVLKAGKTYIPLSDYYPDLRMKYILEDSQAEMIITNDQNLEKACRVVDLIGRKIDIININDICKSENYIPIEEPSINKIAYILYTSGSTGNPKGVMQTQKNILYFAKQYAKKMKINETTRMTLFSSFCHDAAIIDIFSGLLSGATLYPKDIRREGGLPELTEWLIQEKINIWHSVPTLYRHFTSTLNGKEEFKDLRHIVLGGENVVQQDIERFQRFFSNSIFVNLYGQSESSYNSSQCLTGKDKDANIHLGDKLDETEIFVVDEYNEEVMPLGIGEIVINSPYVALGYWNKEKETLEAFKTDSELGSLYWTGDMGRLEIDGKITWLGRKDFQVKIRGYRVELGEIENCIMEIQNVKTVAVIVRDDSKLIAYYTTVSPLDKKVIEKHISDRLPDYMRPYILIETDNIPLTESGKLDRKKLSNMEIAIKREREYKAPSDQIEEKLVKIWEDILGIQKVGIYDNFFELGGHSLNATMLSGKIQKELKADIRVVDIFERQNIAELSEKVKESKINEYKALQPLEKRTSYPISSAQKRLYAIQMMNKESTLYNMPFVLELKGEIYKEKIENAIEILIRKHEVLRTSFHIEGKEIVQKIKDEVSIELEYVEVEKKEELEKILEGWIKPFDLEKAPLVRVGIINNLDRYLLMFDIHHIISDGITMGILAEDFVSAYQDRELKIQNVQYKEYSYWEIENKKNIEFQKQREYWKKEYEGEIPVLELPVDGIRGKIQENKGESIVFEIGEKISSNLKKTVAEVGGTLYMGLMAGYSILLSKYSGQEDLIIGSPIAGRRHSEMEKVAGMFVKTLAIRSQPKREKKVEDYLREMKQKLLLAYENQDYPYEELVEEVNIKRDFSRNPLFDVMLVLHNMEMKEIKLPNIHIKPYKMDIKKSKFDITLNIAEFQKKLICEVEYKSELYSKETIERMMENYIQVLKEIGEKKDKEISQIELLTTKEKEKLLKNFNDTKVEYEIDKTIVELFEEQVEKTPDNIALVYEQKKLTYGELNQKVNQLASYLRDLGVRPNNVVGIMVNHSLEMIVGILGILKSGGAYLPIDPGYPVERVTYMLEDSSCEILLVSKESSVKHKTNCKILNIGNQLQYRKDCSNPERMHKASDLAYIIYTSGSTGKPKGVMVEHRAIHNFIKGVTAEIPFTPDKTIIALTTICFDIFLLETLLPITQGMKVAIASKRAQKDVELLTEVIVKNNVNIFQMTPSRLQMIINSGIDLSFLRDIENIMIGGEAFPLNLLNKLKNLTSANIYNMYGPTETTVWSTIKDLTSKESIDIGTPIANTQIYIMDKEKKLQPIGVPGDLYIAGDGLARGYFNRPKLTAERFVPNPYELGKRMYWTGDTARWLPNGNIEFLGRIDHQVKIRGYRIELSEIESVINKQDGVKESVVIVNGKDSINQYLCAYLVVEQDKLNNIKNNIKKILPTYMVPTAYIVVDKIPTTPNGKIDRLKLLNIKGIEKNRTKIPPRNFQDNTIAEIWKGVLNLHEVYIQDDFFELGGNSINIIQVANKIKQEMGVEISVADLMTYTTILELSEYIMNIESNSKKQFKHVFKINKSISKKNIFILHGADGDIFYYRYLAKLLEDDYSVYGIQPKGLNGEEPFPDCYFEMLNDYIKEIRMIQNEGPYILAGFCIGGYLSYDIVNIFELQGDKVTALLQLDQEAFIKKERYKWILLYRTAFKIFDLWRRISRKEKKYALEKMMNIAPKVKPISKQRQMTILKERDTIRKYFGEEWLPNAGYVNLSYSISSPTLVIKAEDNNHKLFKKELWENMVKKGKLTYYEVPGDHETVLLPPYVDELARIIKEYLDESSKELTYSEI